MSRQQNDGRAHFALGPVERWIVAGGAGLLSVLGGLVYTGVTSRIDLQARAQAEMNSMLTEISKQQAVTNGQIQTLSAQLADVPRLSRDMAEVKVRVDQHEQSIRELRQTRAAR